MRSWHSGQRCEKNYLEDWQVASRPAKLREGSGHLGKSTLRIVNQVCELGNLRGNIRTLATARSSCYS